MIDKDNILIREASSDDSPPKTPGKHLPSLPVIRDGVLKHAIMILLGQPKADDGYGRVFARKPVMAISSPHIAQAFTAEEAEEYINTKAHDMGISRNKLKYYTPEIVADKGTGVQVTHWGPEHKRFMFKLLEPRYIKHIARWHSPRPDRWYDNQFVTKSEDVPRFVAGSIIKDSAAIIDKWVDFSKSAMTLDRLKGLR